MIPEEQQQRNTEVEMISDKEGLKEQDLGHDQPQVQDDQPSPPPPTPPLDDERSAVVPKEADEKEGEITLEESVSTLEDVPELHDEQHSVEDGQGEVVVVVVDSPVKERSEAPPHSPRVASLQVDDTEGDVPTVDNSQVSPVRLPSAPLANDEVVSPTVASPGKKRSKGGRLWKKNGGKKQIEKEIGELPSPGALHDSPDAGTQADRQELGRDGNEADPAALYVSEEVVVEQDRAAAESHEPGVKSTTTSEEEHVNDEIVQHESESTSAGLEREEGEIVEDEEEEDPAFSSLRALRSFGRWADVSEDFDTSRPTDTEPDRIASHAISVDTQSSDSQEQGQELRGIAEQGFKGQDIRAGLRVNPDENGLRGKTPLGVAVTPREDIRSPRGSPRGKTQFGGVVSPGEDAGSPRGSPTGKTQLGIAVSPREDIRSPRGSPRGKTQQAFESSRSPRSPRSRHDLRADSWNNHKEQDVRGKTQLGSRDSLSQASREPNWRRRPEEPRVRQDMPRRTSKLGLDGDTKKDEHQDFRSRSQYGAEPQATHKNWIPRRGLGHRGDSEGRPEQSKARGKGKQGGRETEPQNQLTNDSAARQKFEADLRVKKDELFQRSKLSLKAEFQKAKRVEQARKGSDLLEMELNKNLVYEDGVLFFLNI